MRAYSRINVYVYIYLYVGGYTQADEYIYARVGGRDTHAYTNMRAHTYILIIM